MLIKKNEINSVFFTYPGQPDYIIGTNLYLIVNYINNFYAKGKITSIGRDPEYNKSVGGATRSYHLIMSKSQATELAIPWRPVMAFDYKPKNIEHFKKWLIKHKLILDLLGAKGFGFYDTFVHIDTRSKRVVFQGSQYL